jgi:flavin reductase (DIM6/NTAB) family NADH-FMN oxidoreductase RutF
MRRGNGVKRSLGIQAIVYPTSAGVIGRYNKQSKPDVVTAAWGGICCSQSPHAAVSLRNATYSYARIPQRKAYTVKVLSEIHGNEVDYFGIASGRRGDEFTDTGLTFARCEVVDALYVTEAQLIAECRSARSKSDG